MEHLQVADREHGVESLPQRLKLHGHALDEEPVGHQGDVGGQIVQGNAQVPPTLPQLYARVARQRKVQT